MTFDGFGYVNEFEQVLQFDEYGEEEYRAEEEED